MLCALPAAHAAGIITLNQALCNRSRAAVPVRPGRAIRQTEPAVLDAIERWRPTGVFGFAVTWAELAALRPDRARPELGRGSGSTPATARTRRTCAGWSRSGSHLASPANGRRARCPAPRSSTASAPPRWATPRFHITHTIDTDRYGRCVGKPYVFAEVALLDLATGAEVPVGQVGHLGLKSPTLALGYWNDSVDTYRTRLAGLLPHRRPDVPRRGRLLLPRGPGRRRGRPRRRQLALHGACPRSASWRRCPDVRDCTVVASADGDRGGHGRDVLLTLARRRRPGRRPDRGRQGGDSAARPAATLRADRDRGRRAMTTSCVGPTGKVRKFLMRQRHLATR